MDDRNILDAPEDNQNTLKVTLKSFALAVIGFTVIFYLILKLEIFEQFSVNSFIIYGFEVNAIKILFLFIISLGLYFFISFTKFEIEHWFRVMTISVTIVFLSLSIANLLTTTLNPFFTLVDYLTSIVFIALIAGGGCSLAVQFLLKKQYLIFVAIMICTLVLFTLKDYF